MDTGPQHFCKITDIELQQCGSFSDKLKSNSSIMIQSTLLRLIVMASGWMSLMLGIIGIFLPLLPTTPFVLLSALCFSKSSPRLHHWLINQPRLGPMILNWEQQGSISQSAKVTSTVLIVGLFSFSLLFFKYFSPLEKCPDRHRHRRIGIHLDSSLAFTPF